MNKFIQSFLTGVFFTFILDFFLFLGLQLNYIDHYEIKLYYNILFADNQNIYIFLFFSLLIGFIITYVNSKKFTLIFVGGLFLLSASTLIQPIGHYVGELIFMKKNVTLYDSRHSFVGDIYYEGRSEITFFDKELNKIIFLDKKDLK